MKARLIQDSNGKYLILNRDGTITEGNEEALTLFLSNFKNSNSFTGKDGQWKSDYVKEMSAYPGTELALVTDMNTLVIQDITPFSFLISKYIHMEDRYRYISVDEYAKLHNRSKEMIRAYCRKGLLPGAIKFGKSYLIPKDAIYPGYKRND